MENNIEKLAQILKDSNNIVFFGGIWLFLYMSKYKLYIL